MVETGDLPRIVDSHVHFLDPARFRYPWLDSVPALRRSWSAERYARDTRGLPVAKIVFVEAAAELRSSEDEVRWVEEIAREEPRIRAILARAALTDAPGRRDRLTRLKSHP